MIYLYKTKGSKLSLLPRRRYLMKYLYAIVKVWYILSLRVLNMPFLGFGRSMWYFKQGKLIER